MLAYHETTEEEKHRISSWKYEGDYAVYNSTSYEEQKKRQLGFANPGNHYYSFYEEEKLVGFINLYKKETEIFLGAGINPRCCNRGYGQQMIKAACGISRKLFPGKTLHLEVRTWNARAIRCYEKCGFYIAGEPVKRMTPIGEGIFYRMEFPV